MLHTDYFKDKKVTVMGLGLLGRGVGDAAYIAKAGASEVIVTDLKSETELASSIEQLKEYKNITFVLGEHRREDFQNRDMILVAAGVPMNSEYLAYANEAQIPLKQSAALFAELAQVPIVGVTGTRGKSTVTQMIHHTLSLATGEPILLGGNIRGVSNLQLLNEVTEDSLCVMELDSWQLQGFGWAGISPQIAVFTNLMEDHMNYYGGDMNAYFMDKANIFKNQEGTGVLVTTPEVFELSKGKDITLQQEVILADSSVIPEDCLLAMPGEHNRLNAALAYEALKAISLSDDMIFEGFASFGGVEGRLQYLKEVDGVKIYNDNNATTPNATIAGINAVQKGKNVILIAGGAYKEVDPKPLVDPIATFVKEVILTPGTGTDMLLEKVPDALVVENLEQAIEEARLVAESGDVILFSPAFASFGQYANEYERNDEFVDLIEKI
ncbi:MAG: UDP-N-acetylmuramoylalanine--D-glutamate ligase [Patiriisocius sp.]|jgi:UDP-N-acetylmuramoylalanine--D-glutamate ligase